MIEISSHHLTGYLYSNCSINASGTDNTATNGIVP